MAQWFPMLIFAAVNLLAFGLYALNLRLFRAGRRTFDPLLTVLAVLGGAAGMLLCIGLKDRHSVKANRLRRVFLVCLTVLQGIALLMLYGVHGQAPRWNVFAFFEGRTWLWAGLIGLNAAAFLLFGMDKRKAARRRWRIRESVLLGVALLGGSVGALLGMKLFRHKTKQEAFSVGIPLMLVTQLILLLYLMNLPNQ